MKDESNPLKACCICGDNDVQINTSEGYKPDANCNNCGASYQGEAIEDVIETWNVRYPAFIDKQVKAENRDLRERLEVAKEMLQSIADCVMLGSCDICKGQALSALTKLQEKL